MIKLLALLKNTVFLWILLGSAIILGLVGTCHRTASPAIPPKVQARIDALEREKRAALDSIASLKTSSAAATAHATTTVNQARGTVASSDVNRRLADSLAKIAAATDSAELAALQWRRAYTARTAEADSLRAAVALLDSAQAERERARVSLSAALAISEARRERSEQVNTDLQRAIARASAPCKILWLGPKCPSRVASFALGNVSGAAIVLLAGTVASAGSSR